MAKRKRSGNDKVNINKMLAIFFFALAILLIALVGVQCTGDLMAKM